MKNNSITSDRPSISFPAHRAHEIPELSRPLTETEYEAVEKAAVDAGIEEGWFQDMDDPTSKRGA